MKLGSHTDMLAATFFCLLLACFWGVVEGHGFLLQPMGRTFVSYKFDAPELREYNPEGANAGGKQHVYDGGLLRWPNGRFGLCGDPWDQPVKRYEQPGRITAAYTTGSELSLHLVITANHWGRMQFSLCPLNATAATYTQACTLLQRADGKGPYWTLPPGELPDAHGRPLIPTFNDGSYTLYTYPEQDDFRDTPVYVVRYRLPPGVTCEHCMLHWYWLTGNSCNPPCEASDPLYPDCNRLQMGYCGEPGTNLPEEFWGCSDISISGSTPPSSSQVSSSLKQLNDRLKAAQEAQEQSVHPQPTPVQDRASHWRPELLQQADQLDAAAAAAHRARHHMPVTRHATLWLG